MAKTGRLVTLKPDVISSARRFESRGKVVTTLSDFWLTCRYLAGGNPNALAKALRRLSEQDRLFDAADSHDAGKRPANLG
jgi:hypothetical protein